MDTLTFKDGLPITSGQVSRVLGLADQCLEDWRALNESHPDEEEDKELAERQAEWEVLRPLLVAAPDLAAACKLALEDFGGRPAEHYPATRNLYDCLTAALTKAGIKTT